jgi:hypothetical protein
MKHVDINENGAGSQSDDESEGNAAG